MPSQKIEFTAKNAKPFIFWLKRFSLIDNSLLLELDESNSIFVAKTYNEERSIVKMSTLKFDEAGLLTKKTSNSKRVRVGIFNISKLIKTIEQFNDKEFTLTFVYDELSGEESLFAGTNIILKNDILKSSIDCTSLNIFKYIADDLFTNNISNIDKLAEISLTKETIDKINSLSNLYTENEFLEFKNVGSKIYVCDKTFELFLSNGGSDVDNKLPLYKEQFVKLDSENYKLKIGEEKLVFVSENSETVTVMSSVMKEE